MIGGDARAEIAHVHGIASTRIDEIAAFAEIVPDVEEYLELVKVRVSVKLGDDRRGESTDDAVELVGPLAWSDVRI